MNVLGVESVGFFHAGCCLPSDSADKDKIRQLFVNLFSGGCKLQDMNQASILAASIEWSEGQRLFRIRIGSATAFGSQQLENISWWNRCMNHTSSPVPSCPSQHIDVATHPNLHHASATQPSLIIVRKEA